MLDPNPTPSDTAFDDDSLHSAGSRSRKAELWLAQLDGDGYQPGVEIDL